MMLHMDQSCEDWKSDIQVAENCIDQILDALFYAAFSCFHYQVCVVHGCASIYLDNAVWLIKGKASLHPVFRLKDNTNCLCRIRKLKKEEDVYLKHLLNFIGFSMMGIDLEKLDSFVKSSVGIN